MFIMFILQKKDQFINSIMKYWDDASKYMVTAVSDQMPDQRTHI